MTMRLMPLALSVLLAMSLTRCDCGGGGDTDAGTPDSFNVVTDAGHPDISGQDVVGQDVLGQDVVGEDVVGQDAGEEIDAGGDTDAGTGSDGGGIVVTESCSGAPSGSADPGSCEVTTGSNGKTLLVGNVLTPGTVYENGGVLYDDNTGIIDCVGCDCAAQATGATTVVCNQAVITPGLINTHDHIGWMKDHPRAAEPTADVRYEHRHDWRKGDSTDGEGKISTSGGSSNEEKAWGELRFVLGGATSVNGSGTAPGLMRNLDKSSGLEGLSSGPVQYQTFPLHDSNGTTLASGCNYPSYDPDSVTQAIAYTPHVSEGINDFARNEFICLNSDANGGHDILTSNTAIIHGVGLNASDIDAMAAEGMKLIWSPRSNVSLYGETADVTLFKRLGVPIALGTDWIPSGSMNMLRELACADYLNSNFYNNSFSDEDLWRMATYDAAVSVGMQSKIGLLAQGLSADIAIFFDHDADPFGSVVRADLDDMILVMRGGQILAGHSDVVDALETGCDEIDVCGQMQRACLQREIGMSYSALQSSGSGTYALFFCGVPDNEPSCVPFRGAGESQNGSSVFPDPPSSADLDGDGVANDDDNCPNIFNPIRPMDNGVQSDMDGDQVGDVCDVCPLDANTDQCSVYDPDDRDRDGVSDLVDNCLGLANSGQEDADQDDKGDACDACPNDANPGSQGCPSTVFAVQNVSDVDHPEVGSRVRIACTVSAVGASGLWCQDRSGGAYSGIYVYAGTAPVYSGGGTPALGDDVSVDGTYEEYNNLTEITAPVVSLVASGTPLVPEVVAVADVANGGSLVDSYQSVLVRVNDVEVTVVNPDAPDDYDEFTVTSGLRVDDLIYTDLDNTYAVGEVISAISGVMFFSYSNAKILPRDAADLEFGPPTVARFNQDLAYLRPAEGPTHTLVTPLMLEMTRATLADAEVTLSAAPEGLLTAPTTVTVLNGESSVEVLLHGQVASDTLVHLTATYGTDSVATDIRILADDAPAMLVQIDPSDVTVATEQSQSFTVSLDIPAPVGGAEVVLEATPDGVVALGTIPASVNIGADEMSASFDFTAGAEAASGTITAHVGSDEPVSARVNVIDPSLMGADLSGLTLTQAGSDITLPIPDGTQLPMGGYLIVARNATKAAFETHWGVTLGENVTYINGIDITGGSVGFPSINGDETYTLSNDAATLDGPTIPMLASAGHCYQRQVPVTSADSNSAWVEVADTAGTPGSGQTIGSPASGVYISEFCDALGTGNYVYEYVELFFDGNP